ncbi:MAG: hypothetical protein RBQ97_07865 [Acholeplasma sp.]|nr:hypothetical protein [Acholeplasma sp.]
MKKKVIDNNLLLSIVEDFVILGFGIIMSLTASYISPKLTVFTPHMMINIMTTLTGFTLTALIFAKNAFKEIKVEFKQYESTFRKGAFLLISQVSILLLYIVILILFDINPAIKFLNMELRPLFLYFIFFMYTALFVDLILGLYHLLTFRSNDIH